MIAGTEAVAPDAAKTEPMKIGAIAPWFGGKRTLAPVIVSAIGQHSVYWELCAGSLAVLFAKPPCRDEIIVDLHGDATNLARVLASGQWWELCDRVQRTIFSDSLFEEAKARLEKDQPDELERAYDYLVVSWMGLNGVAGTARKNSNFCIRYTSNGGDPAKRWRSVGESIPAWHERLSAVRILRRDIFTVAERIEDKAGTVIYIDPPYFQKSHKYLHDFDEQEPKSAAKREWLKEQEKSRTHERLAALLSRFNKTRVVVSYYDHPSIRELYGDGWHITPLRASKGMVSSGMRDQGGATEAPEVLITNFKSQAEPNKGELL